MASMSAAATIESQQCAGLLFGGAADDHGIDNGPYFATELHRFGFDLNVVLWQGRDGGVDVAATRT